MSLNENNLQCIIQVSFPLKLSEKISELKIKPEGSFVSDAAEEFFENFEKNDLFLKDSEYDYFGKGFKLRTLKVSKLFKDKFDRSLLKRNEFFALAVLRKIKKIETDCL